MDVPKMKQEKAWVRFIALHALNTDRQCRSGWCCLPKVVRFGGAVFLSDRC